MCVVDIANVQRCVLGQHSELFKKQKASATKYQIECSFSLYYTEGGSVRYVLSLFACFLLLLRFVLIVSMSGSVIFLSSFCFLLSL